MGKRRKEPKQRKPDWKAETLALRDMIVEREQAVDECRSAILDHIRVSVKLKAEFVTLKEQWSAQRAIIAKLQAELAAVPVILPTGTYFRGCRIFLEVQDIDPDRSVCITEQFDRYIAKLASHYYGT